jgi:TM2 domain-containing membrane protein YozV
VIYCQDHVPVPVYGAAPAGGPMGAAPPPNPYAQPAPAAAYPVTTSPVLAFILGWIPGVGAIYNGQYIKGLVHAIIFGLLVSVISESEGAAAPLLGITMAAFVFYMPFEAFHTAKRRQLGLPVDEWSSLTGNRRFSSRAPIGPIVLIAIGIVFLLDTLHLLDFHLIARWWPVLLIVVGVYMLYARVTGIRSDTANQDYSSGGPAGGTGQAAVVGREQ